MNNQKGFVSLIVASTILIVLALITIGFANVMRREQRQALDRQLSRQAVYAAESGINSVFRTIVNNDNLQEKKECGGSSPVSNDALLAGTANLSQETGVQITCVLFTKNPTNLEYTPSPTQSKIIELSTASGNNLQNINFKWGSTDDSYNQASGLGVLPQCTDPFTFPTTRNNAIPMMKLEITSLRRNGATPPNITRSDLLNDTQYLYMYPCYSPTQFNASLISFRPRSQNLPGEAVQTVYANCNVHPSGDLPCRVTVSGLSITPSNTYLLRFRPIYGSARVDISASERLPLGTTVVSRLKGQFSIDVTARAADVVRRLRATKPETEIIQAPEGVIHSMDDICKRLVITSSFTSGVRTDSVSENCSP